MHTPMISVCMPAYKADRYLRETLDSLRRQTFTDWELVVVEDGSRDNTESILHQFRNEGPQRVRYFRHNANRGLSETRNTGFQYAEAELLTLLDSDDIWHPSHLASSLETLRNTNADVAFSGCELFDSDTAQRLEKRVPPSGSMEEFPLSLHDGRVVIQPSTVTIKKSIVSKIGGFNPRFPICNDLEYWFRAAKAGARFAYTGFLTCNYRKHATALSKRSANLVAERAEIHRLYRHWDAIPRQQIRREAWRHHRDAARMIARTAPLRSLSLLIRGGSLRTFA